MENIRKERTSEIGIQLGEKVYLYTFSPNLSVKTLECLDREEATPKEATLTRELLLYKKKNRILFCYIQCHCEQYWE